MTLVMVYDKRTLGPTELARAAATEGGPLASAWESVQRRDGCVPSPADLDLGVDDDAKGPFNS